MPRKAKGQKAKKITRYQFNELKEAGTPETGQTAQIEHEETVELSLDNGWSNAVSLYKHSGDRPLLVDMDPVVDPILMWAGKRSHKPIAVLPLQRNEIMAAPRIAHIVDRATAAANSGPEHHQGYLFADLEKALRDSDRGKRVEFYRHEENWRNKIICGDSLEVMESLIRYENLGGKIQVIYLDPPYGIKYDANFQQRIDSTRNDDNDRADDVLAITAYNDTWSLGPHSYLSYLQERLYLCRAMLAHTGSIFVQINDENLGRMQTLLDEVFGAKNRLATIVFVKTTGFTSQGLSSVCDYLLWYVKDLSSVKYRQLYQRKGIGLEGAGVYNRVELPDGSRRRLTDEELASIDNLPDGYRVHALSDITSQGASAQPQPFEYLGKTYRLPPNSHWKTTQEGLHRLAAKGRLHTAENSLRYIRYYDDFPYSPINNVWLDTGTGNFTDPKIYAVQTGTKVVERCISMASDPGDLVFDPTCGSGTTAFCAEKLGRRWITCDTSRVAVNVARQRLLSAIFDHYETLGVSPAAGFKLKTADRITLKSTAFDLEPERIDLVDQPIPDPDAVRICGPFEVMTLGRYSIEDWKGYVGVTDGAAGPHLENYISVIAHLYRPDSALGQSGGFIHALVDGANQRFGISVGPIGGRVSARQILDAHGEAAAAGLQEVHILGWAFEANVGELTDRLAKDVGVEIHLVMIRPDSLADGLKITRPETLFSPLAVPDIEVRTIEDELVVIVVKGLAVFDRKTRQTEYKQAQSGYVSAWYLDEDYDGDCFVDCQMFFNFVRIPRSGRFGVPIGSDEFTVRFESDPFAPGKYRRAAVRVVDVFGNESTVLVGL